MSSETYSISSNTKRRSSGTQSIISDTQSISSDTQNVSADVQNLSSEIQNRLFGIGFKLENDFQIYSRLFLSMPGSISIWNDINLNKISSKTIKTIRNIDISIHTFSLLSP